MRPVLQASEVLPSEHWLFVSTAVVLGVRKSRRMRIQVTWAAIISFNEVLGEDRLK